MTNLININNTIEKETYRKISHEEVHQIFKNALDSRGIEYTFQTTKLGRKTTTVGFKFTLTGLTHKIHGDSVSPTIVGRNSLNKESSINFRGGFYRFACANQMVVGQDFFIGKIIHRIGETFEEKVKKLDYQIAAFLDEVESLYKKVEESTNKDLTVLQMCQILEKVKVPKKVKKTARKLIVNEHLRREEDRGNNTWTLWNIINESIRNECKESAAEKHNDKLMEQCINYAIAA
jgi:hypothetical protein